MNPVPKPDKKEKKKPKRIRAKRQKRKKELTPNGRKMIELEGLWSELVKIRARHQSELSGRTQGLQSHHINGKSTHLLRFSLISGIVLTSGEHKYGIHNPNRAEDYRKQIIQARGFDRQGQNIYEVLNILKHQGERITLADAEAYLHEMKYCIIHGDSIEYTITPNKIYPKR